MTQKKISKREICEKCLDCKKKCKQKKPAKIVDCKNFDPINPNDYYKNGKKKPKSKKK